MACTCPHCRHQLIDTLGTYHSCPYCGKVIGFPTTEATMCEHGYKIGEVCPVHHAMVVDANGKGSKVKP